jgi:hypothetical protein
MTEQTNQNSWVRDDILAEVQQDPMPVLKAEPSPEAKKPTIKKAKE